MARTSDILLSVIVPIHNEENSLWEACQNFAVEIQRVVGSSAWQYVLVENGSTDRSLEIAGRVAESLPPSKVVKLPVGNYGNALREGMLAADGLWSLIINVDHIWDNPYFMWAWNHRDEYDMIIGSKRADPTLNRQDQYRRVLTAGLNAALQYLFDCVAAESHGMKLLRMKTMKPLAEKCIMRKGQFDTELTLRALRGNHWVAELPMPYQETRKPRNFMIKKITQNLVDLFRLYRTMKEVPYLGAVRYRRFCREDMTEYSKAGE